MDSEAFQSARDVLDLNFQCELRRGRGLPGGVLETGAGPGPQVSVLIAAPFCPALAMKHMDLKQMELDTAAAKVDELTKQLESLWSDSPTPPGSQAGAAPRVSLRALGPTLAPQSQLLSLEFSRCCRAGMRGLWVPVEADVQQDPRKESGLLSGRMGWPQPRFQESPPSTPHWALCACVSNSAGLIFDDRS